MTQRIEQPVKWNLPGMENHGEGFHVQRLERNAEEQIKTLEALNEKLRQDLIEITNTARKLLDETELEFEGSLSRELRKILWNDADTEELKRIEG